LVAIWILLIATTAGADPFATAKTRRQEYEAERKQSGEDAAATWTKKVALADALERIGDFSEAARLGKEVLAWAEKHRGAESAEVKQALEALRVIATVRRDFAESERLYQRILAISKKLNGERSSAYADDLGRYANHLADHAEYAAAQRMYEQAMKIDAAAGKDVSGWLAVLGLLYLRTNQQTKAVAAFDRHVALNDKEPVEQRIDIYKWVAARYRHGGRPDLADKLDKRALELCEQEVARLDKAGGALTFKHQNLIDSLGQMYDARGELERAERMFQRLVAVEQKSVRPTMLLAHLRRKQGRLAEARKLVETAKAKLAKQGPVGRSQLDATLAELASELGDHKRAEQLYVGLQAEADKRYGKRAMLVGRYHLELAGVYIAAKQLAKAERVLGESLDIAERELAMVLASGTESDHLSYFGNAQDQLETALAFHRHAPKRVSAATLALTTVLRRKGRVLDAAAGSLATLRGKLSPDDKKLLEQLVDARAKLAKLAVAGPQSTHDHAKQVTELEDWIRSLEITLARKHAAYRVASQPITLAAVQKQIPRGAKLVEIIGHEARDFTTPMHRRPKDPPRHYSAYVVGERGAPVLIELGPAKPIDAAIAKLRAALADPDNDQVVELSRALHALTFGKLVPALGGSKEVLLAPDGAMNLVPFAALHDGKSYLIARYTFTYLTSGRDLLRLGTRAKPKTGTQIFANPSFDAVPGAPPPPGNRRSRAMATQQWAALPGTGQEADQVAKWLTGATIHRDQRATEAALKAVSAPRVLHIATHGFFLADEDSSEGAENPLLRSGLALAGANKLASGSEDGVLTALEASSLDLWGTRLVVLSACETGVGKVSNGEGVYGLRRSLVIAGAESLVMTLWQVDDLATRDLMTGYYEKLQRGAGRSAALRTVQLEIQTQPRYAHPYFWASFVPAGDARPLGD
jgi:CHAT domain-containing protein